MRRSLVVLVLSAFVVACGDMRPTTPGQASDDGTIRIIVPQQSPLVGSWSFSRYFYDASGSVHLSQTVWTFGSDGRATRTVYADNLSLGFGDVIVTSGRWIARGSTLEVLFDGSTVPARYEYRFEGGALILAGIAFLPLSQ